MRFVKVIVIDFKTSRTLETKGGKPFTIHEFSAHETDQDGARIPVSLTTANDAVVSLLRSMKGVETMIPFSRISTFNDKDVFTVDESILKISQSPTTAKA